MFKVGDRVRYTDRIIDITRYNRTFFGKMGTIMEVMDNDKVCRVKWDHMSYSLSHPVYPIHNSFNLFPLYEELQYDPKQQPDQEDDI